MVQINSYPQPTLNYFPTLCGESDARVLVQNLKIAIWCSFTARQQQVPNAARQVKGTDDVMDIR